MNWKKHAYLFTNGEFKIQVGETICDIIAWNTHGRFSLYGDEERKEIKLMHCTLIARKIDSLSDEEIGNSIGNVPWNSREYVIETLINQATDGTMWSKSQNYLLSIGVYPFSQKHFEDETVIDIKTLTEEQK